MLDDALLDDPSRLVAGDRSGLLRAAATAGAQVRATFAAADEAGLASLSGLRPRALVLLARPGPAETAVRIGAALLAPTAPLPVLVASTAPPWLGALDVVVVTHDGTEGDPAELAVAESVDRAVRRGATVVSVGPDEGPVPAAAAGRAWAVVPRMPVPGGADTATALAATFAVTGTLELLTVDREALADRLDDEAERDGPRGESFVNPAKSLALRLAERTPLLCGVDDVAVAVAAHGAALLAARAGVVAHAGGLAGLDRFPALRDRLGGAGAEASIFADPFDDPAGPGGPAPRAVLVAVREDVRTRHALGAGSTRRPDADVLEIDDPDVAGNGPAADALRACLLAARLEFAAVYLGLATGVEPALTR